MNSLLTTFKSRIMWLWFCLSEPFFLRAEVTLITQTLKLSLYLTSNKPLMESQWEVRRFRFYAAHTSHLHHGSFKCWHRTKWAVRGFGLKLQPSSSSTGAWQQVKPSASTHVHLLHLPLTAFCEGPSSSSLVPLGPRVEWEGGSRPQTGQLIEMLQRKLEEGLKSTLCGPAAPPFLLKKKKSISLYLFSVLLRVPRGPPVPGGALAARLQLDVWVRDGTLQTLSLCLIHGCWSWLAGRWSLLVADTETSWEVRREVRMWKELPTAEQV